MVSLKPVARKGFTLVEAVITVAIIAVVSGVIVVGVGNLTRVELRKSASALAATIRQTYNNAALSGQTMRLIFDFASPTLKLETTTTSLGFDPETGALHTALAQNEAGTSGAQASNSLWPEELFNEPAEDKKHESDTDTAPSGTTAQVARSLLSISSLGGAAHSQAQNSLTLTNGVHVLDVWTDAMSQPAREGEVALVFFPGGYTQDAIIHLEDDDKQIFALRVYGLTGKTHIVDGYLKAPK